MDFGKVDGQRQAISHSEIVVTKGKKKKKKKKRFEKVAVRGVVANTKLLLYTKQLSYCLNCVFAFYQDS